MNPVKKYRLIIFVTISVTIYKIKDLRQTLNTVSFNTLKLELEG